MRKFMRRILRDNKAATAVEYGLIAALIVVAALTALNSFSNSTIAMFSRVESKIVTSPP